MICHTAGLDAGPELLVSCAHPGDKWAKKQVQCGQRCAEMSLFIITFPFSDPAVRAVGRELPCTLVKPGKCVGQLIFF